MPGREHRLHQNQQQQRRQQQQQQQLDFEGSDELTGIIGRSESPEAPTVTAAAEHLEVFILATTTIPR